MGKILRVTETGTELLPGIILVISLLSDATETHVPTEVVRV